MTPDDRTTAIDDPGDPRVAVFRDIRERDLVGRSGFIAEGRVVLQLLLASQEFEATALLILRNRRPGLAAEIAAVPANVPVHVAEQAVFDRIAGFPVHRGILAHGIRRDAAPDPTSLLSRAARKGSPVVVAVGIANHDNVGAIFRNAAAFGAGAVILDETSCHPLYRKAVRVSVGTVLCVPWSRGDDALSLLSACEDAGFAPVALSPSGGLRLDELVSTKPVALFLGAEGPGLPERLIEAMTTVRIPMAPDVDSLNVATAAALVLHQLYSQRGDG